MSNDDRLKRKLSVEMDMREAELFDQWRTIQAEHLGDGQFIEDGIVHFPTYNSMSQKLLFLLKEPNDPPTSATSENTNARTSWNLASWLGEGAWEERDKTRGHKTWEVIARWVHSITSSDSGNETWREVEKRISQNTLGARAEEFRKIAVVNLKKCGGAGYTDMTKLADQISSTRDLVVSQIRLYSPSIVVCCGTYYILRNEICRELAGQNQTERGVNWYLSERLGVPVVDYPHYGYYPHLAPAIKPAMHFGLVDAVREILPASSSTCGSN